MTNFGVTGSRFSGAYLRVFTVVARVLRPSVNQYEVSAT